MHTELRRPGVTLELLHLEYLAAHRTATGIRRSAGITALRRSSAPSMRQSTGRARKRFVDYAGSGRRWWTRRPASCPRRTLRRRARGLHYTYAEATSRSAAVDFIQSHTRAVEYFGGVSAVVVPDQLRTAWSIRVV